MSSKDLVEPGPQTLPFAGKRVRVFEWEDGRVEIRCEGQLLPYSPFAMPPASWVAVGLDEIERLDRGAWYDRSA